MRVGDVLRYIVDNAGVSKRELSRRLGRYDTWVSATLSARSLPSLETTARVADAAGMHLALVDDDGHVIAVIDGE